MISDFGLSAKARDRVCVSWSGEQAWCKSLPILHNIELRRFLMESAFYRVNKY
jgi:hypothetical protein